MIIVIITENQCKTINSIYILLLSCCSIDSNDDEMIKLNFSEIELFLKCQNIK